MWREPPSWPGELVGPGESGQDNPPAPKEGGLGGGRAPGAEIVKKAYEQLKKTCKQP